MVNTNSSRLTTLPAQKNFSRAHTTRARQPRTSNERRSQTIASRVGDIRRPRVAVCLCTRTRLRTNPVGDPIGDAACSNFEHNTNVRIVRGSRLLCVADGVRLRRGFRDDDQVCPALRRGDACDALHPLGLPIRTGE